MTSNIINVEQLNDCISRISTNSEYVFDIHSTLVDLQLGDKIKVNISENKLDAPYVMFGQVYYSKNNISCVSFGGLLAKLPVHLDIHSNIYMSVSKSKTRKIESSVQQRPNTRQKKMLS